MKAYTLAEVALEVASNMPDIGFNCPRAEWRWSVVDLAIKIMQDENINDETEDLDEVVRAYIFRMDEMPIYEVTA